MSSEDDQTAAGGTDRTARAAGQLVKYSREFNKADSVGEVGAYALEAAVHVVDGQPSPTVFEVQRGQARVVESMAPGYAPGDEVGPVARRALSADQTVVVTDDASVGYRPDGVETVAPDDIDVDGSLPAVSIAAPSLFAEETGEVGVVLLVQWEGLERVEEHHVKPVEYLADHLATAVANIRSRERLERARNDLAKRKEVVEMYDRLLRHDLGNDLQVIAGFSDALVSLVDAEDEQATEYAGKIQRTADQAAGLIERVGDLVKSMEAESAPTARPLESILSNAVADVEAKHPSLTVAYDPAEFETRVYAGDLLDSVFVNVLSNAAVHNKGPVAVDVYGAELSPETFVVGFADDGAGVPASVRDDIFDMGQKGPDSEGSGFGLGLVRALTESYGGTVGLQASEDGGADVRIFLEQA